MTALLIGLIALIFLALLGSALLLLFQDAPSSGNAHQLPNARSRFLAESGLDLALSRLGDAAIESAHDAWLAPWLAVEFQDANKNGTYDPDVDPVVRYDPTAGVRLHPSPSFRAAMLARPADPVDVILRLRAADGGGRRRVGISGTARPLRSEQLDFFAIKVLDCASMLYVNGPSAGPDTWALAPNAVRLLDQLGADDAIRVPRLGALLSSWRAEHRRDFANKDEIALALARAGVEPDAFPRLRDRLTCHAWVDAKTLLPGALGPSPLDAEDPHGAPTIRWGRLRPARRDGRPGVRPLGLPLLPLPPLWGLVPPSDIEREVDPLLGPLPGLELSEPPESGVRGDPAYGPGPLLQPRAPVNVNTATVEVLAAVLANLEARWVDPSPRLVNGWTTGPGQRETGGKARIDPTTARRVAAALAQERIGHPFRCWQQFDDFLQALPSALLSPVQKRLIQANANPNSRLAKFNPDRALGVRFAALDKSDLGDWCEGTWDAARNQPLCGWTTEFCFSSMGYYQVEVVGRSCGPLDPEGARPILAETSLTVVARIYEVLRHTTQKDFEKFSVSRSTSDSGLATVITYPESMADLRLHAWSGDAGLHERCFARPEASANGPACNHALCYDGYVSPAPRDLAVPKELTFRADFTSSLDADFASQSRQARGNADCHRLLIDHNDPSELFPDGVFCHETRRRGYRPDAPTYGRNREAIEEFLRYRGGSNLPDSGRLDFWVKPTWDGAELFRGRLPRENALDARVFLSAGPALEPHGEEGREQRLVVFAREGCVGAVRGDCREATGQSEAAGARAPFVWESPAGFLGTPLVGPRADALSWQAGTWHQVAVTWRPGETRLFVDGEAASGNPLRSRPPSADSPFKPEWSLFVGNNRFGEATSNGFPLDADATIDSLRIRRTPDAEQVLEDRYPGGDAFFGFTGMFPAGSEHPALQRGGRLGTVSWTWYRPRRGGGVEVGVEVGAAPHDTNQRRRDGEYGGEGAGLQARLVPSGSSVWYTVRFLPAAPNGRGFIEDAPILDDVTVTLVHAPRLLLWISRTAGEE
ncbi:MAG: hypothetical protein HYZ53_26640 [Planctomycetes bacterium]|nr:hypothetical protein [Planctomycetota bacterium]